MFWCWSNKGWKFTVGISFLSLCLLAEDMPPCGERLRPTNHCSPLGRFGHHARETALMNQLFASAFLDFQSFLRQMLPEVPRIDLFCGLWGG